MQRESGNGGHASVIFRVIKAAAAGGGALGTLFSPLPSLIRTVPS